MVTLKLTPKKLTSMQQSSRQIPVLFRGTRVNDTVHETSATRLQLNTSANVASAKTLNIQLMTSKSNVYEFICIGTEISVEALFDRVQKRMYFIRIRKQPPDFGLSPVESDDPDTWKMFLRRIGKLGEEGIDVVAAVVVEYSANIKRLVAAIHS